MPLPPLSPEQLVRPRHFEARIALIFASLFVSTGINLPYFPLWLEANGFDAERIAVILAAPMFLRVVTTPFLTAYADRASDRANVLLVLVAAALVHLLRVLPAAGLRRRAVGLAGAVGGVDPARRRSSIRWRCPACAGSARTIPACASGVRSRFLPPI